MNCHVFIVFLFILPAIQCLTIATYNIWNTMFNWNVRKWNINQMIRRYKIDVIAFQEVRGSLNEEKDNQLLEIKSMLPNQYRYFIYRGATNVTFVEDTIDRHYSEEGIGLLSRFPIVSYSNQYLVPHPRDPDKNTRVLLHAVIKDTSGKLWNILVLHLSYYRQQQCRNVADIIRYINKRSLQNVILLGDFNVYMDYEGPVEMLERGGVEKMNDCWQVLHGAQPPVLSYTFTDVWKLKHPGEAGLTFSNMPSPGLESRPDRIYVTSGETIDDVVIAGKGYLYKSQFASSILWERFKTIVHSSQLAQQGVAGYPCHQDCGPHASCVCGVCAAIGNEKDCLLPDCDICTTGLSTRINVFLIISIIIVFHFFYAVLQIFIVAAASYTRVSGQLYSSLGLNCCLLNPQLWGRSMRAHQQRFKFLRLCRHWPLFNLPPYVQLLISVIASIVLYASFNRVFAQVLELTYSVIQEEYFPSDHLMVVANVG